LEKYPPLAGIFVSRALYQNIPTKRGDVSDNRIGQIGCTRYAACGNMGTVKRRYANGFAASQGDRKKRTC